MQSSLAAGERPAPARAERWAEPAAAVAAWAALLWLALRTPCVEGTCAGAGPASFASMALVLAAAWMAPGWMAWRMLGLRGFSAAAAGGVAAGLGLAWLVLLGSAVLALGLGVEHFLMAVAVAGGGLTAAFCLWRAREPWPPAVDGETSPAGARWPALMAALALAALLAVSASSTGFTHGGDEWFYLRVVRQFLDGRGWIYDFDVWELVLALLVRLAGVGLLEGYRVVLPPFLIAFAALAFAALAGAVLRERRAAALAFVLQALYWLSDMHTRGTGAGMGPLARVAEDKYVALLLAVPLVAAAALRLAAGGPARLLGLAVAIAAAGVLVHPLTAVWLAVSLAAPALCGLAGRGVSRRWLLAGLAGAALLVATALWLRSLRPGAYYQLSSPSHARILASLRGQLVVLSREKGWCMGDARLLAHPLVAAALLCAPWLARRARGSPERTFLAGAIALPVVVVFLPPAATAAGWLMSPWMLPRVLWAMPVSLALAAVVQERRQGRSANVAWAAALAAAALVLAPRIARGPAVLRQRNHVHISAGQRELGEYLASDRRLSGNLLAPAGLGIRLPAWTSRVRPLPGLDLIRGGVAEDLAADCERLLRGRGVGDEEIALLEKHAIAYLTVRNGSPLGRKLARLQPAFRPLFHGSAFTLYEWRKEGWPSARPGSRGTAGGSPRT